MGQVPDSAAASHPPESECVDALVACAGYPPEAARAMLDAVELAADAVMLVDAQRRVLYINARAAELTGYRAPDVLGQVCSEALHFTSCGTRCTLFEQGEVCNRHCELVASDGAALHVVKTGRVLRDAGGRIVAGIEAFQDVTELERSRERLARRAQSLEAQCNVLEAFTRSVEEAVLALDVGGRITCLSPHAAEVLSLDESRARGATFASLAHDEGELEHQLQRVLATGERLELRHVRLRRSGRNPRWVALRLAPLTEPDGTIVGAAVVVLAESELGDAPAFHGVVGQAPAMRPLLQAVTRLASSDASVLITGETGTGKELVARALHHAGPRRDRPFHAVNCAALTEPLLESELFGHERGAFTDAVHSKPGRLELCGDGTLLLDEIGCLPPGIQAKLLRVLEQREFERVGGTRTLQLQARVIAATNADLLAAVRAGAFRADLYYRLRVVPLEVPPLRRRREDIPALARHFVRELRPELPEGGELTSGAEQALCAYAWPGNVRELRNAVHYALAMGSGRAVDLFDLPPEVRRNETSAPDERQRLEAALQEARFNHSRAAQMLGISRTTLWRRMKALGLETGPVGPRKGGA